ncbi:hypothetical protein KsCSTR_43130 [Candidatus Kuenenia stuttgartiensis]|uniref:Uncharacterized protein n=1 Tax=Kuenenia stuttgartiensis TaxID=174633 RepID=A0A6G7GWG2_KUEST|nr:hypothetical protein KsCSTR_43130 [Candidatus Kuenenia stuttgartiensis]
MSCFFHQIKKSVKECHRAKKAAHHHYTTIYYRSLRVICSEITSKNERIQTYGR